MHNSDLVAELVRAKGGALTTHIYADQEHGFVGAALDDSVARVVAFFQAELR